MIFNGYENFLVERVVDLSRYVKDGDVGDDFHKNFFDEENGDFFDDFSVKSLFSIFGSEKESEKNGVIDQLQEQGVEHVLLVLPQKFITTLFNKKKKLSKVRIKPREFKESFMDGFYSEFNSNDIGCSIVISGSSRDKKETQSLERWLNIRELQKSLNLGINEAYLLGFKEIKIETQRDDNSISMELNGKYLTIREDTSILMGDNPIFKFRIPKKESVIKITNSDSDIIFITKNIDHISSNNQELQEEYFDNESFDDFDIPLSSLGEDDIDITFDKKTTIMLSSTIKEETPKTKQTTKKPKADNPKPKNSKTIGTDTDDTPQSSFVNLKNRYLVNLKGFITPYEDGLVEVCYHLVKVKNRLLLVGGSQIDKQHKAVAKVVAKISSGEFVVTNLTTQPIVFRLSEKKVEYRVRKRVPKPKPNYIDTDENEPPQNSQEVSIANGESYSFDKKIEFPNSAISFIDSGVAIEYINFTIGSFNHKLEFNRLYYSHFGTGNIIDNRENLDYGGRIFENGNRKILGSSISSRPLILSLRGDSFTLTNSIKQGYSITIQTPTLNQELEYQEEHTISKDDLLSNANTLSINKEGIALVTISIIAN